MRNLRLLTTISIVACGLVLGGYFTLDNWRAEAQSATVGTVAIDLDPSGNTATSIGAGGPGVDAGDIQSTLSVLVNETATFDIVVDAVPPPPDGGLYGVGGNLGYHPSAIEVIDADEANDSYLHLQGEIVPFQILDGLPDTDGSFRFDSVDLSGNEESGPGRVLSVTVRCKQAGESPLSLSDTDLGAGDRMAVMGQSGAITYQVTNEIEATINCVGHGADTVALDLDPAGNTSTGIGTGGPGIEPGDIQSTAADVPLDTAFTVDIVVDAIPSEPGDGLFGVGGELLYDPDVIEVVAVENSALLHFSGAGSVPFNSADALPDTDGSFRFYAIDTSGVDETGPGRLYTFTLGCKTQGQSILSLSDSVTGGGSTVALFGPGSAFRYGVRNELEALVACGQAVSTPTPLPTPSPTPTLGPTVEVVWGDSNCRDGLDPFDAYLVLRYDAGLPTNAPGCPSLGTTVGIPGGMTTDWGDFDCSGSADPVDSLRLLRFDARIPVNSSSGCPAFGGNVSIMASSLDTPTPVVSATPTPSPTTTENSTPTPTPTPTVTLPVTGSLTIGSAAIQPGETVTVDVTVDATELAAYRIDIQYDTSRLTAQSCTSVYGLCGIGIVAAHTVRLNGARTAADIDGTVGSITFVGGPAEGVANLVVDPATLATSNGLGEALAFSVNNGSITVGDPAATATPLPTLSAPALTIDSATVPPGQPVLLNVTADVTELVAYRVDVTYDSSLVVALACHSPIGVCGVDTVAPDRVRVNGTSLSPMQGNDVTLASINFGARTDEGVAQTAIDPNTLLLYSPNGEQIELPIVNGAITIASPTPTPTPSPTPTLAPTASPTPTPAPTLPPPTVVAVCNGLPATIVGTNGPDLLEGTNQADVIVAGRGTDVIRALNGNDVVCAGDGNDIVFGGNGSDEIFGEQGTDTLFGEGGRDTVNGGLGLDFCGGGGGLDAFIACELADRRGRE